MKTTIDKPINISKEILLNLIDLIEAGGQVKKHHIEKGIETADLIAIMFDNDMIVASATLKNPKDSYKNGVFYQANFSVGKISYKKELGYIITNPKYEGQKYCQKLLESFINSISKEKIYATTRKPAMAHILCKFNFVKAGKPYKDDLELFLLN